MMAKQLAELKSMSDEELVKAYDKIAETTHLGLNFYMSEIRHRENRATNQKIVALTRWVTVLTVVITLATIINVAVFVNDSPTIPSFLP